MENKYKDTLEFNKIQNMLADLTTNEMSRSLVYKAEPSADISEVLSLQEKLACMIDLVMKKGTPDISGVHDISSALKRGEKAVL